MARFSADGQDYTRALALGTQAALTVTCWVKLSVNRATWSTPWSIDNGTGDNWLIQTGADGVTLGTVFDATSQQNMGALTVGTWYFVALAMNGSNGFLYHKTAAATSPSTVTVDGGTASVNAATLRIGESPWGGEWWNGCINAVKVWTTQLTAAEVVLEAAQYQPHRITGLTAYYPLVRPETTDYSGNARTLSGGTGATREDGPPIPWRLSSPRLVTSAAAGGGPIVIGQAAEVDTTTGVTRAKDRAVGQATEFDTAAAAGRVKSLPVGRATELDTSAAVARAKSRGLGLAAEVDTATTPARTKTHTLGLGSEQDTAHPVTIQGQHLVAIGQAAETNTAAPVTRTKLGALGVAVETTSAAALARTKTLHLAGATETDTASPMAMGDPDFVCQDFAGSVAPISHAGTAETVAHSGIQPATVAYGGTTSQVQYGGSASICGRP